MLTINTISAQFFQFEQAIPSSTWEIEHNLNRYPIVDVWFVNEGETVRLNPNQVTYVDPNNVTISFSIPQSGFAVLS